MSSTEEHLPSPEPPLALVFHGTGDDLRALFDRLLKDEAVTVENNQNERAKPAEVTA